MNDINYGKYNEELFDLHGVMIKSVGDGVWQCCGCGEIILNPNDKYCRNCGEPIEGILYFHD